MLFKRTRVTVPGVFQSWSGILSEATKAIISRALDEVWNKGNYAVLDELFENEVVHSTSQHADIHGKDNLRAFVESIRVAFPDVHFENREVVAEDDKGAIAWTVTGHQQGEWVSIPPSGKAIECQGTSIFYVNDGKITRIIADWDATAMMKQLGVLPS